MNNLHLLLEASSIVESEKFRMMDRFWKAGGDLQSSVSQQTFTWRTVQQIVQTVHGIVSSAKGSKVMKDDAQRKEYAADFETLIKSVVSIYNQEMALLNSVKREILDVYGADNLIGIVESTEKENKSENHLPILNDNTKPLRKEVLDTELDPCQPQQNGTDSTEVEESIFKFRDSPALDSRLPQKQTDKKSCSENNISGPQRERRDIPEHSKVEHPKVEPSKVELSKVELSKVVLSKCELSKVVLSKCELSKVELSKVELSKVELSKVELLRGESSKVELSKVELSKVELSKVEPSKLEPSKLELPKLELYTEQISRRTDLPQKKNSEDMNFSRCKDEVAHGVDRCLRDNKLKRGWGNDKAAQSPTPLIEDDHLFNKDQRRGKRRKLSENDREVGSFKRRRINWTAEENKVFMTLVSEFQSLGETEMRRRLAKHFSPRRTHEQCANHLRILRSKGVLPPGRSTSSQGHNVRVVKTGS